MSVKRESNLELGADSDKAVMAEVQDRAHADPQTEEHGEVIHQEYRGSPAPHRPNATVVLTSDSRITHTGPDKVIQTTQADSRISDKKKGRGKGAGEGGNENKFKLTMYA